MAERAGDGPSKRGRGWPPAFRILGLLAGVGAFLALGLVLESFAPARGWSGVEAWTVAALGAAFLMLLLLALGGEVLRGPRLQGVPLRDLDRLGGHDFEAFIARRLRREGFEVRRTAGSRDFGLDLVAQGAGRRIGIEVKRHDRKIPNGVIRSVVSGCHYHDCDLACVVTQSRFTRGAEQQAARSDLPVVLIGRDELPTLGRRLWAALR